MSVLARRGRSGRTDHLFDEWRRSLPGLRSFGLHEDRAAADLIRVDEYRAGNTQVIRAELPGIDPDEDVEITVVNGMLRIDAERRVEEESEAVGYTRHELRHGARTRTLPLAEGAIAGDIEAAYRGGILEIRVPVVDQVPAVEPVKIAVTKG